MIDLFSIIGLISGFLTIVIFFTGKPSIYHFLPVKDINIFSFISPLSIRWKFIVKNHELYIRYKDSEIPLAVNTKEYLDYRIIKSKASLKFIIVSKKKNSFFIINNDGRNRHHYHIRNVVDMKWQNDKSFIIALSNSLSCSSLEEKSVFLKQDKIPTNCSGVFLVDLNSDNSISKVTKY